MARPTAAHSVANRAAWSFSFTLTQRRAFKWSLSHVYRARNRAVLIRWCITLCIRLLRARLISRKLVSNCWPADDAAVDDWISGVRAVCWQKQCPLDWINERFSWLLTPRHFRRSFARCASSLLRLVSCRSVDLGANILGCKCNHLEALSTA